MNKNFSLKFKKSDIFVIAISILIAISLIVGILLVNKPKEKGGRYVNIYHQNQRLDQYNVDLDTLSKDIEIVLKKEEYPRLLNDFTIQLSKEKGIRVVNITCYDSTCEKQGWVNIPNLPIVCIPNDVRVEISTNNQEGGGIVVGEVIYYEKKYQ